MKYSQSLWNTFHLLFETLKVALTLLAVSCGCQQRGEVPRQNDNSSTEKQKPTLIILIPGTWGSSDEWVSCIPGKETFASALKESTSRDVELYPFIWGSSLKHSERETAAVTLANLIDEKSSTYGAIDLVGHSHGGNIALRAAGLCQNGVSTIVCLSTPHVFLRVRKDDSEMFLPVYCSAETVRKTERIISMVVNEDRVVDFWSNQSGVGLTENDAIQLTSTWHELAGAPRLANDGFVFRMLAGTNVVAASQLNLATNVVLTHNGDNYLGTDCHSVLCSPSVAKKLAPVIRNPSSQEALSELSSISFGNGF